jgi:tetratricopeptide (TPR) repeat protein
LNLTIAQDYKLIDSLKVVLVNCKNDTDKMSSFYKIGYEFEDFDNDIAQKYFEDALIIANKLKLKNKLSRIYSALGRCSLNKGSFKQAMYNFQNSLKLNIEINDSIGIAADYDNLGIALIYQGNYDSAYKLRNDALDIYTKKKDPQKICDALIWLGNIELKKSNYNKALTNYLKSLEIAESLDDQEKIAYSVISCAIVYRRQNNYFKALEYDSLALISLLKIGKRRDIATVYLNMANIYSDQGKIDQSLNYYFKSLKIRMEIQDSSGIAACYSAIAKVYLVQQKYTDSEKYSILALRMVKENGNKEGEGIELVNLGWIQVNKGNYVVAINYLHKGISISKEIGYREAMKDGYDYLSTAYEIINDNKNALKYFKLYNIMDDSIKNDIMSQNILELQASFETENKDKEIAILNVENKLKQQKVKQNNFIWILTSSSILFSSILCFYFWRKRNFYLHNQKITEVKYKALNAQMSDHFIGNTIDSINLFIENNNKEKAIEYLLVFKNLIRNVLENSFEKMITIERDLNVLCSYLELEKLRFSGKGLLYEVIIDDDINKSNTMIPPMIFQVLAENSIKHGIRKSEGGTLKIRIGLENNFVKCSVEDSGIGRTASIKEKMTKNIFKSSIGTKLAENLINLSWKFERNTSFNIIDLVDKANNPTGTLVEFKLPYIELL